MSLKRCVEYRSTKEEVSVNLMRLLFVDYKTGFGGKFGVQKDRQDKSAVGWDEEQKEKSYTVSEKPKIENGNFIF